MSYLDLLTIGRVSVDLYAEQTGSLTEVTSFRKSVGGTTTNVAVAAARLGVRAGTATKVGDDAFGRYVRHALEHTFGVDTAMVGVDPELPTPLAFAELDPPEDPTIIFYRQPAAPDMGLTMDDIDLAVVAEVPVLWLALSRLHDEPSRSTTQAVLQHRRRATHTVLDLDWRADFWSSKEAAREQVEPLLAQVTMAIGNRTECEVAVGTADPHVAADALLEHGLSAAIVKMGADGVLVATAEGEREVIAAQPTEVVCGLGAGDAFGGALVYGLLQGMSVSEAAGLGNVAGAIVAGRLMCADAMPGLDELAEYLRIVKGPKKWWSRR